MTTPITAAQFLPPNLRKALIDTQGWAPATRIWRIDTLTMQAHEQYPELVRHPGDVSRLGEWMLIRYQRAAPGDGIRIQNNFYETN